MLNVFSKWRYPQSRNYLSCHKLVPEVPQFPSLYSKQSVRRICYNYLIIVTRTIDALGTIRLLFGVYWMNSGMAANKVLCDPSLPTPAMIRNGGVSAVARLNGERPVIIQGSDDILWGAVCGALMQNVAGLSRDKASMVRGFDAIFAVTKRDGTGNFLSPNSCR